jgi:lipopolysaccharide/colanic/teichoic acid biosynthesis glycosyltransferase/glycosyltransferase involved in cell wall biosynthesis
LFDLAVGGLGLIILSPAFLLLAILVAVKLGRPVLFYQERTGFQRRPFRVIKFRTMLDAVDSSGCPLPDEQRLTRFGLFLRAWSLDELPGLWNIVRGEMSIVGPRPLLHGYDELYSHYQAQRFQVRPGMTGWAQVNGRNAISWPEKFALDVWYVNHCSLALDLKIILATAIRVFSRHGVNSTDAATMPLFRGEQGDEPDPRHTDVADGIGGAQRVVVFGSFAPSLINFRGPLLRAIRARGHKVFALAPAIDASTADALRRLDVEPVTMALNATSMNPFATLSSSRALARTFQRLRPDVVIAYTIKPVVLGAPSARKAGVERFVPLITGLGYAFTKGLEPKRLLSRAAASLMYRRAFRTSAIAIFQNPDDLADFRRMRLLPPSLPVGLIAGSGVDLAHFTPAPIPTRAPSFLMIARLLGDKGVREYGAAAQRLKALYPQIRVSLAGWIDSSPNAITHAELDTLVAGGIDYLGRLDDVRQAISDHSVFVLPSYREGTPRSVLEAMAAGRAIITTDAPGCRETVVPGENGLLIPPRNADALFEAMCQFVEAPELAARFGAASRLLAEMRFDVHRVNDDIIRYAGL